jgi:hypothetical protein
MPIIMNLVWNVMSLKVAPLLLTVPSTEQVGSFGNVYDLYLEGPVPISAGTLAIRLSFSGFPKSLKANAGIVS